MKRIILLLAITMFSNFLLGQTKEYFAEKSKRQKTTAWILVAAGSAAIITGVIIDGNIEPETQSFTGGYFEVGGIICALTSIPFFIGSAHNKKRAAKLAINYRSTMAPQNNLLVLKKQPGLSLIISL